MPVSGQSDVNLRFDSTVRKFVPIHITAEPHTIQEIEGQPGRFGIRLIEFPLRASIDGVDPVTITVPNPPIVISGYSLVSQAPAADEFYPDFYFEDPPIINRTSVIYFHPSQAGLSVTVEYYGGGSANCFETFRTLVELLVGEISQDAVKNNLIMNGDFYWWRRSGGGPVAVDESIDPTLGAAYTADRYLVRSKDIAIDASREQAVLPSFGEAGISSSTAMKLDISSVGDENSWLLVEQMIFPDALDLLNGKITRSFWIRANTTGTISAYIADRGRNYGFVSSDLINVAIANVWQKRSVTFDLTELTDLPTWASGIRLGLCIRTHVEEGDYTASAVDEQYSPSTSASFILDADIVGVEQSVWDAGSVIYLALDSCIRGELALEKFKLYSDLDHENERELLEKFYETMYPANNAPGDLMTSGTGFVVMAPAADPDAILFQVPFKKSAAPDTIADQPNRVRLWTPAGTPNKVTGIGGEVSASIPFVNEYGFHVQADALISSGGTNGPAFFYWDADKEPTSEL